MRQVLIDYSFLPALGIDHGLVADLVGSDRARSIGREVLDAFVEALAENVRVVIADCDRAESWLVRVEGNDADERAFVAAVLSSGGFVLSPESP